jgi:iron-sulfur cluster assembly accessory protein
LVQLTERAAAKIREMRTASSIDPSMHLRVDVVGGARSGFAYDVFFDAIDPSDHTFEQHAVVLVVRPDALTYLQGATVDWVESENGAGFLISNPNEPEK